MTTLNRRPIQGAKPDGANPKPVVMPAAPPPLPAVSPLTRDFLAWIAVRPRSYAEAMDAWRTSCPRLSIWEDAIGDGLIHIHRDAGASMSQMTVVLTPRGRAILESCA
jgi:hypothetical protein